MSPAEERAEREGLAVVNPVLHELMVAASGNPITVSTTDGTPVLLRLATVDEFIEENARAIAGLPEGARPDPVTRARAAKLVAPIPLGTEAQR